MPGASGRRTTKRTARPLLISAAAAAGELGTSRITARRYLEYLADAGVATRTPRYGGVGRPETEYRWR